MLNTITLPILPLSATAGSIESYIQNANRFPMLSQEEELALAERLYQDNDVEAARQLVLCHLRLVISIARGYLGYGLPHADLIQEGNIGLMKAVKRFDPQRGVRLVSFAIHWIKAEIHEYILRNWRLVKVATTKAQRKLFFNLRSLKKGFTALTQEEAGHIAQQLNVKPEDVIEMESRMGGHDIALEGNADEDDEYHVSPISYLVDPQAEPSDALADRETEYLRTDGLKNAIAILDQRSQEIIKRRWLKEEGESSTLHELAAEFNVSAERIRQIEVKAMQKIRASFGC